MDETFPLPERYVDQGPLGEGGMGFVRRVWDTLLGRHVAMKVLRSDFVPHKAFVMRFVQESQITAQLGHPSIIPVYDRGVLDDGRPWFTMKEVRGRTLADVIDAVHEKSTAGWGVTDDGWGLRALVDAFHKVCEAMAQAHARGVIHRDLKSDNVMVGPFGEVMVMDWGLARAIGEAADGEVAIVVDRKRTRAGMVAGTPSFMAPEQARGEVDKIDARTDVYALGAILWNILAGVAPWEGHESTWILEKLVNDQAIGPPLRDGMPPAPEELVAIVVDSAKPNQELRPINAEIVAKAVARWLDGARRSEQAVDLVASALSLGPQAATLHGRAAELRADGERWLSSCEPWDPESRKAPGWTRLDEAARHDADARRLEREAEGLLRAALMRAPDLAPAHAALAERARIATAEAETRGDVEGAAREETRLSEHIAALPQAHPERERLAALLRRDAAIVLHTDPPGAHAFLYRWELRNRRWTAVPDRPLGKTPLVNVTVPAGRWLIVIHTPGRAEVRYPIRVERGAIWHGVPPGAKDPLPVPLPKHDDLGPGDVYVPPGWFLAGGDPEAREPWPLTSVWVDGFVIHRFPLTHQVHKSFLDDLVARGRGDDVERYVPRDKSTRPGEPGAPAYVRNEEGMFELPIDVDGDRWLLGWPVFGIDLPTAVAIARWVAERTKQPWRLPGELEREKAVRGVDARTFPMGDFLDPSWASIRGSRRKAMPTLVGEFPLDESPYGVRDGAGGVADWCGDRWQPDRPRIVVDRAVAPALPDKIDRGSMWTRRGSSWGGSARLARCASRVEVTAEHRDAYTGVRLIRSWPR